MKKATQVLVIALKVVMWTLLSIVMIITIIAVMVQIPCVQQKMILAATNFIKSKTHTVINIESISLFFPRTLVINGLYLEDKNSDTLLYAGIIEADLSLTALLANKIHLSKVALSNVNVNLKRPSSDSLFNFDFMITAFNDTTKAQSADTSKKTPWSFEVDDISMNNIHFNFYDDYGGTRVAVDFRHLALTMELLDIEHSNFAIDELSVGSLRGKVVSSPVSHPSESQSNTVLPRISANSIKLIDTQFSYEDSTDIPVVIAGIFQLSLQNASVDLQSQQIKLEKIALSKSKIQYIPSQLAKIDTSAINDAVTNTSANWIIEFGTMALMDNSLCYGQIQPQQYVDTFNVSHQKYEHVSLRAENFFYASERLTVDISDFTLIDQNGFAIKSCAANFRMDQHSISAHNLKIQTISSFIDADLRMQYTSLESLENSLHAMIVSADLRQLRIKSKELLYFVPALATTIFFKEKENTTQISGKISGRMDQLSAQDIIIKTGSNTFLSTDGAITGLPKIRTAFFSFPNLTIATGRNDIKRLLGSMIPSSIDLPEQLGLAVAFRGRYNEFNTIARLNSSFGNAHIVASIDETAAFSSNISLVNFELGRLLQDTALFGSISLTAQAAGHGLFEGDINAAVSVNVAHANFHHYNYHNILAGGNIIGKSFEGVLSLNDENAILELSGKVNLDSAALAYKFHLNLQAANLQKLKITTTDLRIGLIADSDIEGDSNALLKGRFSITNLIAVSDGKTFVQDSAVIISLNEAKTPTITNALLGVIYHGNVSPFELPQLLTIAVNRYFPFSDTSISTIVVGNKQFTVDLYLRNDPVIAAILLPQLKEFEPIWINMSVDQGSSVILLKGGTEKLVYGTTEILNLAISLNSDSSALNYTISSSAVSNTLIKLDNLLITGILADQKIIASISSTEENNVKLRARIQLAQEDDIYSLSIDPNDFYLMNNRWDIAADNYIKFGPQGFLIHHLFLSKAGSQIKAYSVNDRFNDDLSFEFTEFILDDLSQIIEKDSSLVRGTLNGKVLFKKVNDAYGLIADASINNLIVQKVPIGNLSLTAENPTTARFDIKLNLSGAENKLSATAYYLPNAESNSLHVNAEIEALSLQTIAAFSLGNIIEASGTLSGSFLAEGTLSSPDITGELKFEQASIKPAAINTLLRLGGEPILIRKDGVYFNSFTVLDVNQHLATINGSVKMHHFSDFIFAVKVNTEDFLLFNTTAKDNEQFYGRMIVDSKIEIDGPINLPVISAKIRVKKGSSFTFAVIDDELTTDKGESVVEFNEPKKFNKILSQNTKKTSQRSGLTGLDLSSIIEIDKQATLRLLIDPSSGDSLVVHGEAGLNFSIDRSGKMSLTGTYNVNEGSYVVSLGSVLKRNFAINSGSTILWNGDLLDAQISINAVYTVRAAPIDLVADQVSGLMEEDKNKYKQRYLFFVLLKLRGALLHPDISFEIQLPPEDKGILGGAVNAKLSLLNEDLSALNKQVFALLVLGRFIQENPLQSESYGTSAIVRTTVGKYISAQLNQWGSGVIPGVELNFDIQSYDDYQSGQAKGRTQLDIGIKKELFKERLSVQVGGTIDVEGENAKKNSVSNITSDVTVEYKVTKDGRYLLKGFRHNQYDGAIEGQVVETGVGVLYVRDFYSWDELFKSPPKSNDSTKRKVHEPVKPK